ncbi:MAG: ATP-dependent DNA helicase RecG, partial [Ruminococcus sp.]|nr:ATP-dependent DNA helicase RecG [Ruminococcus sp.]
MTLFSEIECLKGVGKARGENYRRLGICTPYDLIYHIPRGYLDFRTHIPISQAENDKPCVLKLTIKKKMPPSRIRNKLVICKASATDGIDDITIVIYNNVYNFKALTENETYYMYG